MREEPGKNRPKGCLRFDDREIEFIVRKAASWQRHKWTCWRFQTTPRPRQRSSSASTTQENSAFSASKR